MKYWELFWTLWLIVAGAAFTFITLVVIIRAGPDLRDLLRHLRRQNLGRLPYSALETCLGDLWWLAILARTLLSPVRAPHALRRPAIVTDEKGEKRCREGFCRGPRRRWEVRGWRLTFA